MELEALGDALISLVPPILVGILFYVIMRGIFRADATERKVYAKMDAEIREARASRSSDSTDPKSSQNGPKNGKN